MISNTKEKQLHLIAYYGINFGALYNKKKKNDASFEFCSTLPEKEEKKKSKDKKSDHYPLKKILSSPNTELVETEK